MQKKISIITINLNNVEGLRQTIGSVITQLNKECEYLIIDGESKDGSLEVIKKYENKINYWTSEPNSGIYSDMNKGITRATGEYCLFLNSGDWLNENILSEAIKECTGEDIIYFNTYLSYDNIRFEKLYYPPNLTMRSFFKRTIGHQSTLIKRDLFVRYGTYNENFRIHSDYEFWIKSIVIGNATCKYVNKFLSYYDMGGRSSNPQENALQEIDIILSRNLPKRMLDDYEHWYAKEIEMEILMWYRNQKFLYGLLVFICKVIKKLRKTNFLKI